MINSVFTIALFTNALAIAISFVWLINGLFCKVLNLVPRHQLIVANILGNDHASFFTKTIGVSEILMAVWIMSNIQLQLCAVVQILVVSVMNIIEFIKVPQLLLFGRLNILVAAFFIAAVYCHAFVLPRFVNR